MKKAFGQTVRDLKREVNKKVLKVPGIEQKVLDATSNEPWGPHGSHLADIAQASRNHHEYQLIMSVIWKRINDTGRNWRHVYKGLTVLEYLVAHGTDRVIDEIKEHAHQISTLSDFQYIDSSGRDQGSNVRKKSQMLVALVNNRERIEEIRQKASSNQDKYRNGPYLSSAGGHGDRYDDDRYGSRYGSRDDGKYGRGGGPNGRDSEGYYGRDDNNRGTRGNDDYRVHSRARSVDGGGDRSFDGENNDHYMSRNPDERLSEQNIGAPPSYEEVMRDAQSNNADEREDKAITMPELKAQSPSESKSSSPSGSTNQCQSPTAVGSLMSPGNEEILSFEEFDPRGSIIPAAPLAGNSTEVDFLGSLLCEDSSNSSGLVPESSNTTSGSDIPENPSFEDNFMALPLTSSISHQTNQDPFGDSPFKAIPQEGFLAHSTSNITPFGPVDGSEPPSTVTSFLEDVSGFDFGDPLHASNVPSCQPVSAKPEVLPTDLSTAQPNVDVLEEILPQTGALATIPLQTMPDVPPARSQTAPADLFSQLAFPEHQTLQTAGPNPFAQSGSLQLQTFPAALPNPFGQPELLSQTAASGHFSQSNVQVHGLPPNNVSPIGPPSRGTPPSLPGQSGLSPPVQTAPLSISVQSTKLSQSNEKFEPKSAVWADTLSRGLINLDISGVKTNPLAEIGIDFDSINRMEKRKEQEKSSATPMSTITMGKAMGSGSGIGRAGANGIASLNLMMGANMGMGMGMGGYAGGMNQPMGMGMGMHMGMGMDMAMGQGTTMRPGFGMPPGPGVPGSGYNPMMGMGGYGSQQPYGGGYR